jgi:catalase-peroxidase
MGINKKKSAGAHQWVAKSRKHYSDAFDPNMKHLPTMVTTDLSFPL